MTLHHLLFIKNPLGIKLVRNGFALQWAADPLRSDREVVLAVVQQTGWPMQKNILSLLGPRASRISATAPLRGQVLAWVRILGGVCRMSRIEIDKRRKTEEYWSGG